LLDTRNRDPLRGYSALEDVEVAAVCDPDENVLARALKAVDPRHKRQPKAVRYSCALPSPREGTVNLDRPAAIKKSGVAYNAEDVTNYLHHEMEDTVIRFIALGGATKARHFLSSHEPNGVGLPMR
jgi:hypothetical protein